MKIIAYTYCADVHCPHCTGQALIHRQLTLANDHPCAIPVKHTGMDEFGIPLNVQDREGNLIHPVFDIDEDPDGTFTHCGDCHQELA